MYIVALSSCFCHSVPVYDARSAAQDFAYQLKHMTGAGTELALLGVDVPVGSCIIVGYTASTWTKQRESERQLSLNVRWVMVLGTPFDAPVNNSASVPDDGAEEEAEGEEAEEAGEDVFKVSVKGKGKKKA